MNFRSNLKSAAICVLAAIWTNAVASPLAASDPASAWSNATSGERASYANSIAHACMSNNCNTSSIKACLDEALKPPVPKVKITIAEAAATCIILIKSEQ